ncbi:uncharacterized protein DNG_10449 [Cephalotrichum gorgonifer]|uniref:Uncharacterized protein n=1 Tax=Cephalotrichum gorgonifer TaxID=2041049 RepID=A0AAE8T080_9PEZI|nr:uncharacterized protein DNG_10449 [Cephalotrichum gorgonifer]
MAHSHASSSDEEGDYDYDPQVTLEEIERSKTISFSIHAGYTDWKPREAFRELVQNWRDGIIRSFRLQEKDFHVIREEKSSGRNTEIIYKVLRFSADDKKEWLGYIRFLSRDGEGTIDITNRSATLQPWHFDLGGTSKTNDSHQASAHGEGFKIALLVLMRSPQNHTVRCRPVEDQCCRQTERNSLPFVTKPGSDVQFIIGERHMGRDKLGNKVKRDAVSRREFDEWTKAALFLHDSQDGAFISTLQGDILTHPGLCGARTW